MIHTVRLALFCFTWAAGLIAFPTRARAQCPPNAQGPVIYNPWYPGNVIPFFSTYPFLNQPYLPFDRSVPAPIPPPPITGAPAPWGPAPIVPQGEPYAIANCPGGNAGTAVSASPPPSCPSGAQSCTIRCQCN